MAMPPQAANTEAANTALQNKTQTMFMKSPRRSRKEPPKQKWVTPNRRLRGRIFKPSELIQKRQRKYVAWKRLNQFRRFVSCVCMTHIVSIQDDFLSAVTDEKSLAITGPTDRWLRIGDQKSCKSQSIFGHPPQSRVQCWQR